MACKPGSVPACAGDGHSSGTPVAGRLARPTRTTIRKRINCHPYLVLLPVGLALPRPLPCARCALTAPFQPCSSSPLSGLRRSRPFRACRAEVAKQRRRAVSFLWRYPWGRPRRTLSGTVSPWSPDFPPSPLARGQRPSGHLTRVENNRRLPQTRTALIFADEGHHD